MGDQSDSKICPMKERYLLLDSPVRELCTSVEWIINDFMELPATSDGQPLVLTSPDVSMQCGKHSFSFIVQPKYTNSTYNNYHNNYANVESVAVKITFTDEPPSLKKVIFNLSVSILDASNEKLVTVPLAKNTLTPLVTRASLSDAKYLVNGRLRLLADVKVKELNPIYQCNFVEEKPKSDIVADLKKLWERSLSDLELSVQGKIFKAHKAVLGARSPVFEAMFSLPLKENLSSLVKIEDAEPDAMEEVLRYIYTGETPRIKALARDILPIADRYQLIPLKGRCAKEISQLLSPQNALENLQIADLTNSPVLKEVILQYIAARAGSIIPSPAWDTLVASQSPLIEEINAAIVDSLFSKKEKFIKIE